MRGGSSNFCVLDVGSEQHCIGLNFGDLETREIHGWRYVE